MFALFVFVTKYKTPLEHTTLRVGYLYCFIFLLNVCLAEQVLLCSSWFIPFAYFVVECLLEVKWTSVLKSDSFITTSKFMTSVDSVISRQLQAIPEVFVAGWNADLHAVVLNASSSCWSPLMFDCFSEEEDDWICGELLFPIRRILIQIYMLQNRSQNSLKAVWLLCVMADLIDLKGLNISSL